MRSPNSLEMTILEVKLDKKLRDGSLRSQCLTDVLQFVKMWTKACRKTCTETLSLTSVKPASNGLLQSSVYWRWSQKIFSLPRAGSQGQRSVGNSWVHFSTLTYTAELILWSIIFFISASGKIFIIPLVYTYEKDEIKDHIFFHAFVYPRGKVDLQQ